MKIHQIRLSQLIIIIIVVLSCTQDDVETTSTNYLVENNFPKPSTFYNIGQASGVAVDLQGQVMVFHRDENPLLVFDKQGSFIRNWKENLSKNVGAHGLRVDKSGNVWVTNYLEHQVIKYDSNGNILLTLGEKGVSGDDNTHFNQPTDIAFAQNGDFYVSDGYGNSRVIKYNSKGEFILKWGSKGSAQGQFNLPHAIQTDSNGDVYVGDRENFRIQVFSPDGKFKREMTGFSPYGLFITPEGNIFVADGKANKVIKMTLTGEILDSWGTGPKDVLTKELMKNGILNLKQGNFSMPHGITVDSEGDVYVVEINGKRVQKFSPKK